jgi:hypothetical protein
VIDTISSALPYQQVFERIRAEFLEMPGMRLTPNQVERLAGVDRLICKSVLDDLVRAGFLCIWEGGSYGRPSDVSTGPARLPREHGFTASNHPLSGGLAK